MRILWAGIGPWHKTAYGQQTRLFAPRFRDLLGHEVVISLFGRKGIDDDPKKSHPESLTALRSGEWNGIRVIGPGRTEFAMAGDDQIREAFGGHDPDLYLTLKDPFVLPVNDYKRRPGKTAVWANIDCRPLSRIDRMFFTGSGARPVAVSKFGWEQLSEAGFDPLYVPHAVDLAYYGHPESKAAAKELLGLPPGSFTAGMCAMNTGTVSRKAFYEQMAGWSMFTERGRVPDCYLMMHTNPDDENGIPLRPIARHLGIDKQVLYGASGNMQTGQMLTWFQALDVLLQCTYGEGFGVPVIEAMACGVPVIGSRNSAVTEKITKGKGWLVGCQDWWHPEFEAAWGIPRIPEISAMLGRAQARITVPPGAVDHYDADYVTLHHWKAALEELAG